MKIHGVPIIGDLKPNMIHTLKKLELCTPKHIWDGIKYVFIANSFEKNDPSRIGAYYSGKIGRKGEITVFLDKCTVKITDNRGLPFIYVNTYHFNNGYDEWNLAFNIVHEIGHHVQKSKASEEYNAHMFSLKYVKPYIFKRNKIINYYSEVPIDWNNLKNGVCPKINQNGF